MSDKIIINIISKTYAAIVSFLFFIVLLFLFLFILLQNGLYLDNLHISNIHLKKSYIRLDNKFHIAVDKLTIDKSASKDKKQVDIKDINSYLHSIANIAYLFKSVAIKKIETQNLSGTLYYEQDEKSFFNFSLNDFVCKSELKIDNKNFIIRIKKLQNKKYPIDLNATIIFDTKNDKQYFKINTIINNDANITAYALANNNSLHYNLIANKDIDDIKSILKLIPFDKHVKYWAYEAVKAKNVTIKSCHGFINYNKVKNFYKNLYVNAVVNNLTYSYNKKLHPIVSEKTLLKLDKGILYIYPIHAKSYDIGLKKSWLKIDFTQKHEMLDLYLLLDGSVNDDILHLLSVYKIKLPLKQNRGLVKTKIHLQIDLQTIETDVKGEFFVKSANINFMGIDFNVKNAHILLDNNALVIEKMRIQYKNILQSDVKAKYNVKENIGKIEFNLKDLNFKGLSMDASHPLHISYTLQKDKNILDINRSYWSFHGQSVMVDAFNLPYNISDSNITFPPVMCKLGNMSNAIVGGSIDLNSTTFDFNVDLLKFNYGGITLSQTMVPLKVHYNKSMSVTSPQDIYFSLNGSAYKLKNFHLSVDEESIDLKRTHLEIGRYIKTKVYAKYLPSSHEIRVGLNDFVLQNPASENILYRNNKIRLQAKFTDDNITIASPQLNADFYSDSNIWKLNLHSLDRISHSSTLLQHFHLTNAEVSFSKKRNEKFTKFNGSIQYPYALLMKKNKEIHKYKIKGKINKNQKNYLNINNKVKIEIGKKIKIIANNAGVNIHQILKLIEDINSYKTKPSKTAPNVSLNATNSYIYIGKDRYVISDNIYLQYINKIVTAQLSYKKGIAGFRLSDNKFYLYGKNFNDKFMQELSALSKFKGGSLDFSMQGTLKEYDGVFFMKHTTMKDYKILNNVLAFINTVPSLVTFQLPEYNKNGLYIKQGYLNFHVKDELLKVSDLYLESKELKILGKGKVDITHEKIDLALNLKSDLASNISKAPLVGYIIFDGQSLSTTLKVSGDLNNPKVDTQVAKDIVVAPFNIIKRTLTLPYKLIQKAVDDINTTK